MKRPKKKNIKPRLNKIDLHGLTIQKAYEYFRETAEIYSNCGITTFEVITGKSGQIRKEFPIWLEALGYTGTVATHDGSFTVNLKG